MEVKNQTGTKIYMINTEAMNQALCPGFEVRHKMCLIVGPKGCVLTDHECIHYSPAPVSEPFHLPVWEKKEGFITIFPSKEIVVSVPQMIEFSETKTPEWKEWIHYFGIKSRIYDNFRLLKKSLKAIGATVDFPDWNN